MNSRFVNPVVTQNNQRPQLKVHRERLDGLDLARFIAFVGMVIVNFTIVMGADGGDDLLSVGVGLLEGRAAATFVVLAGIGLGLARLNGKQYLTLWVTVKRAFFLLVIGLLNMMIFDADIIHYYAFYFLFGVCLLHLHSRRLVALILIINLISLLMMLGLDFERGWDFANLSYVDFWTLTGFIRNLFFNGWHPVLPWLSFLLYGVLLSRLELELRSVQFRLIGFGSGAIVGAEILSLLLRPFAAAIDPQLIDLVTTEAFPATSLYLLAGGGAATAVIGLCLSLSGWLSDRLLFEMILPAGRQSLSLYIAHIIIGMGLLEAFGLLGGQSTGLSLFAAVVFCWLAVVGAFFWSCFFRYGPVELLMRTVTGESCRYLKSDQDDDVIL